MFVRLEGAGESVVDERDLKSFTYPPLKELRKIHYRSVCLGSYIPWDVKRQVRIIQEELGWSEDQVENVPPGYGYEKIECYMQGVRDYIKFIKRGYTRPSHLASLDIRNHRMTREEAVALIQKYEGRRPPSLDLFLEYVGLSEEEFVRIALSHVVSPYEHDPLKVLPGEKLHDFDLVETRRHASERGRDSAQPVAAEKCTSGCGERQRDSTIGLVDYGMGNLLSVRHALEMVGAEVTLCREGDDLRQVERIVLPGVDAFRDCMMNLKKNGLIEDLEEAVLRLGKPILGICLGMQAMARRSFEGGEHPGLGWLEADVVRLHPDPPTLRVPQIGWNEIDYRSESPFFKALPQSPDFYFVHSYFMKCDDEAIIEATCDYGGPVTAAVRKGNIFATQFHPEKSQEYGLKVLEHFLTWKP